MINKIIILLILTIALFSCKHEPIIVPPVVEDIIIVPEEPQDSICDSTIIYFQNDVLPILQSSCATTGCHSVASQQEGVILNSFSNIIQTGGVVANNATNSELYQVLNASGNDLMPPASSGIVLSLIQKNLIKDWINQGANNTKCDLLNCDTTKYELAANIKPLLDASCVSCHSSTNSSGGVSLDTYTSIKVSVDNGKLLASIKHETTASAMPQGASKWDACKITIVEKWIAAGAPNN